MGKIFQETSNRAASETKIPWLVYLFLIIVFFAGEHDWFFSLKAGEGFNISLDTFTTIVQQGNEVRRIAFLSLGFFAAILLLFTKRRDVKINGALGWTTLLLVAWAFLSLTWSESPSISFRRLVLFAIIWLSAFVLSRRFSIREILLWVFFSTVVYLHIGLLAEIMLGTFHPLTGGYRFAGTVHPNVQAIYCTFLFYASILLFIDSKRWRFPLIAIAFEALVFLFLTRSRTSLGSALFAPILYYFFTLPWSSKGFVITCVCFLACLLLLFGGYLTPMLSHLVSLGRGSGVPMLTGRIPLWTQLISYIMKHPVHGYGYNCFFSLPYVEDIASDQGWVVTEAHSSYISMCLGLGVVGCTLFIGMFASGIRRTIKSFKASGNIDHACLGVILLFSALNALTESIVILPNEVSLLCIFILARLGFSRWHQVQ